MEILKRLAALEAQVQSLTKAPVQEAEKEVAPEAPEEAPVDLDAKLSPEVLEKFYDGILSVLGELELEGQLPPLDSPQKVRDALLAIVRQLYIKKSMISKMGRKFARFGAKRFLRKQRNVLGKAVSQ